MTGSVECTLHGRIVAELGGHAELIGLGAGRGQLVQLELGDNLRRISK